MSPRLVSLALGAVLMAGSILVQAEDFPGVSRYSYYSGVTWHLRHPMLDDGKLIGVDTSYRDHSVFSDAGYADLFPVAGTRDGYGSMANAGLTLGEPNLFTYLVLGGVWTYRGEPSRYVHSILGGGVREPLGSGFVLDAYVQGEIDSDDGFDWEAGVSPFSSIYFSPELRAHLHLASLLIVESQNSLPFVQLSLLRNLDQETSRLQLSTSRRDIQALVDPGQGQAWDIELQGAVTRVDDRIEADGSSREGDDIWEARLKFYASTVGDGPLGEPRPGIHLHVSYVEANGSGFEGLGGEVGFGAGQFDTRRPQELYFTLFYNYSGYFYRSPSLVWGGGLVGMF